MNGRTSRAARSWSASKAPVIPETGQGFSPSSSGAPSSRTSHHHCQPLPAAQRCRLLVDDASCIRRPGADLYGLWTTEGQSRPAEDVDDVDSLWAERRSGKAEPSAELLSAGLTGNTRSRVHQVERDARWLACLAVVRRRRRYRSGGAQHSVDVGPGPCRARTGAPAGSTAVRIAAAGRSGAEARDG